MLKLYKKLLYLTVVAALCLNSCAGTGADSVNVYAHKSGKEYDYVKFKVYVKSSKSRYSSRVILRAGEKSGRFTFISPVGSVWGEVSVKNGQALFLNFRERELWRGDFKNFTYSLWKIGFKYKDFRDFIIIGNDFSGDFRISSVKKESTGLVKEFTVKRGDLKIRIKILKRAVKEGSPLKVYKQEKMNRFKEVTLREIFE